MNRDELIERLKRPEWSDAEFKQARNGVPKRTYEAASAFANTEGGTIVFGVRDRHGDIEVVGVDRVDKVQNEFLSTIRSAQKLSREIEVSAEMIEVDGKTVLAFFIPESPRERKPVYLDGNPQRTFVRRGGCNERCRRSELERFLREAAEDRFDSRVMAELEAHEFFHPPSLRWYRSLFYDRNRGKQQDITDVEFLHERGFVVDCGDRLAPTRAAVLVFGRSRYVLQVLPRPVIDCQLIDADSDQWSPDRRWTERFVVEDNLLQAWLIVSRYYSRHIGAPFSIDMQTLRRNDHPPGYVSFREAVINQLIHQDYGDRGRTPFVRLFRDRMVFWNPGDAPATTGRLLDPTAKEVRNPEIVAAFRRIGLSEQAGTGIRAIFRNWRRLGHVPPVISNNKAGSAFELSLVAEELLDEEQLIFQARLGARLDESQAALVAFARRADRVTVTDAKGVTGLPGPEALGMLDALVVQGLLAREGALGGFRLAAHLEPSDPNVGHGAAGDKESGAGAPLGDDDAQRRTTDKPSAKTSGDMVTDQGDQVNVDIVIDHGVSRLTARQRTIVDACDVPRSLAELMDDAGVSHRSHFRRKHLSPLLAAGLVRMTNPANPRASNQKYVLTAAGAAVKARWVAR